MLEQQCLTLDLIKPLPGVLGSGHSCVRVPLHLGGVHSTDEETEVQECELSQHSHGTQFSALTSRLRVGGVVFLVSEDLRVKGRGRVLSPSLPLPAPSTLLSFSCQSLSEKPKPQALLGPWPQASK